LFLCHDHAAICGGNCVACSASGRFPKRAGLFAAPVFKTSCKPFLGRMMLRAGFVSFATSARNEERECRCFTKNLIAQQAAQY
jgi:hypothetical protein